MATKPLSPLADARGEHREEVQFRTRSADEARRPLLVVNVSPSGMMIRADAGYAAGDVLPVQLPVLGRVEATVIWALGGRMGCRLAQTIPLHQYHAVLAAMR